MNGEGTYPSKIMLVGEYGVVVGGSALTVPYPRFRAVVRSAGNIPARKLKDARQSLDYLQDLYDYIKNLPADTFHAGPDLDLFSSGLQNYWLDVDIPAGYGLGSSGAVSAAVYDLFFPGLEKLSLQQRKEDLAAIESYFHGKSSGLDALTCHTRTALRIQSAGSIEQVEFNPSDIPGNYLFFLLDSGERFDTGPLVRHFLEQLQDPGYKRTIEEEYLPLNQMLIEALLDERAADPAVLVKILSDFQMRFFRQMIPDRVLDLWIEGQVSDEFYLKLNGSGGGYMLGITHQSFMEILQDRWGEKLHFIV